MLKFKLVILSIQLYLTGLYLTLFKKLLDVTLKKNSSLSRKSVTIPYRMYEHSKNKWMVKEKKFILLFITFNSINSNDTP